VVIDLLERWFLFQELLSHQQQKIYPFLFDEGVRLAFAMTVNKSQGQSLRHVGLDLRTPVFSHGQLYVGLSRCTSGNRLKVLLKEEDNGKTQNIVYKEILTGLQL
jgi:Helicase